MLSVSLPDGLSSPYPIGVGNAPATQAVAETTKTKDTQGSDPAFPRYFSPIYDFRESAQHLVMIFRDRNTGEVINQIPSEAVLRTYEEALKRQYSGSDGKKAETGPQNRATDGASIGQEDSGSGGPGQADEVEGRTPDRREDTPRTPISLLI